MTRSMMTYLSEWYEVKCVWLAINRFLKSFKNTEMQMNTCWWKWKTCNETRMNHCGYKYFSCIQNETLSVSRNIRILAWPLHFFLWLYYQDIWIHWWSEYRFDAATYLQSYWNVCTSFDFVTWLLLALKI